MSTTQPHGQPTEPRQLTQRPPIAMNLATWLLRTAQSSGPLPALARGTSVTHSYQQLAASAQAGAQWLSAFHGVSPGDRVGLFMGNCTDYIVAMWAAWWAGAVVVPMNARLHGREAAYILGHSGARLCLCDAEHADAMVGLAPEGCTVLDIRDQLPVAAGIDASLPPTPRTLDDAAWLFYTSGTTGRPKGVTLSVRNLQHMALAYTATVQHVEPGQTCLHPAPLSHGSGLYHLPYVMNGGLNVVPASGGLDCDELFALAGHWGNASLFAAPTIVNRLAARAQELGAPPAGFSTIVCGGAPMYVQDLVTARESLGPVLAQIYGQGEAPMTITVLPRYMVNDTAHPMWRERLGSVGVPQPMVDVSIQDETGRILSPGMPGEVCVRGDVVMTGYWCNPEATAACMRHGWLATGDIGRMDANGLLTLLDRSKDLVISGGNNIYPREVEEMLLLHPDVREVAVVGRPDPQWGESLVAWVVARAALIEDELDAHCLAHMARYKRPKVWRLVPELPKNNYGKVLKTELRQREALWSAPDSAPPHHKATHV